MRKSGSNSFWQLRLPQETKYYVPKLLAVAAILKNPKRYGVQIPTMHNKPYFSQLIVKKSITLAQVAKSSNIDLKVLHALNPDYDRKQHPRKDATLLLVPVNKVSLVKSKHADSVKVLDVISAKS
jgi:membrane-bound lytic murein transglycosylase D